MRKVLSMALQEAVERGRLPRNPVVLTQPPWRDRSFRKQSWTLDEARRFLAGVAEHRLPPGLRHGAPARRAPRLAMDRRRSRRVPAHRVAQQLSVERGRPALKQLKTESSERIVAFGPGTASVLTTHRGSQGGEQAFAGDAWQGSGLVFTTPLGGWIDPNNFSRTMDVLVDQVGVPRITPRGLRHTAQSVGRVVVGGDKVMQERLGHADIGITLGSDTHVVTEQHRDAGRRLDEVFGP